MDFTEKFEKSPAPLLGCMVGISATTVAQLAGRTEYDWIMIDWEHSPLAGESITSLVQSARTSSGGTQSIIVRLPAKSEEWVKWALDSGCDGIMVPMCNTAEQALQVVKFARYACHYAGGERSFGPRNAVLGSSNPKFGLIDYVKDVKTNVMVQLENIKAVENIDEIFSVPGVDSGFVGPFDLRLSMGLFGGDGSEDIYLKALEKLVSSAKAHNKLIGIYAYGTEPVARLKKMGFDFFLITLDYFSFAKVLEEDLSNARKGLSL